MTTLTAFGPAGSPGDMTAWDLSKYATAPVLISNATRFTIQLPHHMIWDFFGTDFTYDVNNRPVSGTLTAFTVYDNDVTYDAATDLTMDIAQFKAFMAAKDVAGFQHALLTGDDTIFGAYHAIGYEGNDTITIGGIAEGGAGDDTIIVTFASPAPTTIDAGDDNDTVIFESGVLSAQVVGGSGTDQLYLHAGGFDGLPKISFATFDEATLAALGFEELRVDGSLLGDETANTFDFSSMPLDPSHTHALGLDSGAGDDTIVGLTSFSNLLYGGADDDSLTGGDVDDTLSGGEGSDVVYGGGGKDVISLTGAGDTVYAGTGDDEVRFVFDATIGAQDLFGGDGTDLLYFSGGTVTIDRSEFDAASLGFEQAEVWSHLRGTDSNNVISFAGVDSHGGGSFDLTIGGLGGDDTIKGMKNNRNSFDGGTENDKLYGGRLVDFLSGGDGNDLIVGGAGDDHIFEGDGVNRIKCGGGNDIVTIAAGENTAHGGSGNDQITSASLVAAHFYGGAGDDTMGNVGGGAMYGGKGNDSVGLSLAADAAYGGGGNDQFNVFHDAFAASDTIDGGIGHDSISFEEDIVLNDTMLVNVEAIGTNGIHLTTADGTVAAGATLTVTAGSPNGSPGLDFDGSLETDGKFSVTGTVNADTMTGGTGDDQLSGGFGDDTLTGGLGADNLVGGQGADLFVYTQVGDSTGSAFDLITLNPDDGSDFLGLPFALNGIDATINSGTLNAATFNSDMAAAVTAAKLGAHHALVFNPNVGDFSGSHFIIVDANNVAGYQADQDFVIRVSTAVVLTGGAGGNSPAHAQAHTLDFGLSVVGI